MPARDTDPFEVIQETSQRLIVALPNRLIVAAQNLPGTVDQRSTPTGAPLGQGACLPPVVSVQYQVKTGSIYEGQYAGKGLSHYLEHLVAGGTTTTRSEAENSDRLADIGGQMNAFTGLEGVGYFINTTAPHAEAAIELVTDWVQNNAVDAAEVARERDVIQREFEMGAGEPARLQWKLTQEARFTHHPARHPIIGYLDNFKSVTRQELLDFYQTMYVPNNMVCVVVGDICPRTVVRQVAGLWSKRDASPSLPAPVFAIEPPIDSVREVIGHADVPHPRVRLAWTGVTQGDPDEPALDALAAVLGQGESSRLTRLVRDEQGLVVSIGAYNAAFEFADGIFGIDYQPSPPEALPPEALSPEASPAEALAPEASLSNAKASPEKSPEKADAGAGLAGVEAAVLAVVQGVLDQPVTEAELARVKRQILAGVVQGEQSVQQVAGRLCRTICGLADADYLPRYNQQIQALTIQDVMSAARRYIGRPLQMRIHLLPLDEQHPEPTPMPTKMPGMTPGMTPGTMPDAAAPIAPISPAASSAPAAPGLPTETIDLDNAARIQTMRRRPGLTSTAAGATADIAVQHVLSNGLRVVVERSARLPAVSMQLYRIGGLLGDGYGNEGVRHAASAMLTRGIKGYSAVHLAEAIESLGATLDAGSGASTDYVAATCLSEDFDHVAVLFRGLLLEPTFDGGQWRRMQARLLAAIDNQTAHWRGELASVYRPAFFGEHPWSQSPLGRRGVVASLTAEALADAYAAALNLSSAVLTVVGDVEIEQTLARLEDLFGGVPDAGDAVEPVAPALAPAPVAGAGATAWVRHETAKPTTSVQAGLGPGIARGDADYPAMAVLATLASNFPSGYLDQALRGEGPGLVYAVGASLRTGAVPGALEVVFNTDAGNVQEAITRVQAVMRRLADGPIDPAHLKRAKAKVLTGQFMGQQTLWARATEAALVRLYGAEPVSGKALLDRMQSLTIQDVQAVAQRRLARGVWVVAGPKHPEIPDELTHQP